MMSQSPIWLEDAHEIRALLHAVVDRFDAQPGESRARNIVLRAEQFLSGLARNDSDADQTWALVRELETLGVLVVQRGRQSPYDSPWTGAKLKFAPASEAVLREWLSRPGAPRASERWRSAVARFANAFADHGAALTLRRIAIPGRTDEEVVAALASLNAIDRPATLRQLSARAFWGQSKVLDDRVELVHACFPDLPIRERPIVVAVHLPVRVEGVLFIENQDTYTSAVSGHPKELANLALVYMAGFRTAAARIRARDGACLHFSSDDITQTKVFERWWFDAALHEWPLHFWGDLDFAGMQILKSLRARFGNVVAWKPGYALMMEELLMLGAHSSGEVATRQIDPQETGCAFADAMLLPAIRAHGFRDQERIA